MATEIPNSIEINGQEIKFRKIHQDFSTTEPGIRLKNNTRWSRYQGELNNQEWEKMMGYDVNNFEHGRLTFGITRLFIDHINQSDSEIKFNPEEQRLLLLTAIVHDWPEGITKNGDVSYDQKTTQDEAEELTGIEQIITGMFGQENLHLSKQIQNVLDDRNSKLGMAFNAIERIGYLRTGLRGWEKSKITPPEISTNLIWLTNNAILNQVSKLVEYSSIYPPIDSYLQKNKKLISEVFDLMSDSIFEKYNSVEEKGKNITKFNLAKNDWAQYIGKI